MNQLAVSLAIRLDLWEAAFLAGQRCASLTNGYLREMTLSGRPEPYNVC